MNELSIRIIVSADAYVHWNPWNLVGSQPPSCSARTIPIIESFRDEELSNFREIGHATRATAFYHLPSPLISTTFAEACEFGDGHLARSRDGPRIEHAVPFVIASK